MITVRATPLAFISSSRVSGVASRSGTRAPSANGNAGSCFHTWTWGSRIRGSAASALAAAPASRVRRGAFGIDGLQFVYHVLRAAFVTDARSLARHVEIDAEPPFVADRFQHTVAAREIHVAIAQIEDIVEQLGAVLARVLVVQQHEAALMFLDGLDHIAMGQIEIGRSTRLNSSHL